MSREQDAARAVRRSSLAARIWRICSDLGSHEVTASKTRDCGGHFEKERAGQRVSWSSECLASHDHPLDSGKELHLDLAQGFFGVGSKLRARERAT